MPFRSTEMTIPYFASDLFANVLLFGWTRSYASLLHPPGALPTSEPQKKKKKRGERIRSWKETEREPNYTPAKINDSRSGLKELIFIVDLLQFVGCSTHHICDTVGIRATETHRQEPEIGQTGGHTHTHTQRKRERELQRRTGQSAPVGRGSWQGDTGAAGPSASRPAHG